MEKTVVLKAIADESRIKILTLLLKQNYCVRALARNLCLTEATISQHLKVLREAGLVVGEKRGYFMHYDVERSVLHKLAAEIEELATIERAVCAPEIGDCHSSEQTICHVKDDCSNEKEEFCGDENHKPEGGHHGNCNCHRT